VEVLLDVCRDATPTAGRLPGSHPGDRIRSVTPVRLGVGSATLGLSRFARGGTGAVARLFALPASADRRDGASCLIDRPFGRPWMLTPRAGAPLPEKRPRFHPGERTSWRSVDLQRPASDIPFSSRWHHRFPAPFESFESGSVAAHASTGRLTRRLTIETRVESCPHWFRVEWLSPRDA